MALPLAVGSLLLGGLQAGIGAYQLNQLNKTPVPNYGITPELQNSYGRAETRAGYGYSPEQRADYMGNVAGRNAQVYNNAIKLSGGNLSGALARGIQSSSLRDYSTFAANDAALQQNNIRYADQIGGQMTNQRNMATNQNIQNRIRQEQAWGGALQSGLNNIAGAANFFQMNGGFNQPKDTGTVYNQQQLPSNTTAAAQQTQFGNPTYGAYGSPFQPTQANFNSTLQPQPGLGMQQPGPFGGYGLGGVQGGGFKLPAQNWGANNSWLD